VAESTGGAGARKSGDLGNQSPNREVSFRQSSETTTTRLPSNNSDINILLQPNFGVTMPDIETLSRHSSRLAQEQKVEEISSSEDEEDEEQEYDESAPLEIPEACLACGKEKVTHLTVPCRHACLCRACAMKMATGGRCKVFAIL